MSNLSKLLANKTDLIFETWKEKVRASRYIEISKELPETALGNSVPKVIEALISVADKTEEEDLETVVKASLEHGSQRAALGFEANEIAGEYRLLRLTIFSTLEPDLLQLSPHELNCSFRRIDAVVDEAISQCFDKFVEDKIQRQEKIRQQLVTNNQELKRLLGYSQDSFSQLAHEIKTPLNSIMGYAQLLQRQQAPQKDEGEARNINNLERVLRSSRQLLQLVNDSLEISRFDAGNSKLQLVSIDVRSVINSAMETIEPLAEDKGLQLENNCDRAPTQVTTDPSRLQQALTNFLSNAVRYTDEGSISVNCEALSDEKWSLIIADTGIGISPEDRDYIFAPFSRAHSSQEREGSTGLGLTIASRLVKLLQGEIELESQEGEGSKFTLTFPQKVRME